jgi:hypothetical protein
MVIAKYCGIVFRQGALRYRPGRWRVDPRRGFPH